MPKSGGKALSKCVTASNPPAEAPIPTTEKAPDDADSIAETAEDVRRVRRGAKEDEGLGWGDFIKKMNRLTLIFLPKSRFTGNLNRSKRDHRTIKF